MRVPRPQVRVPAKMAELKAQLIEGVEVRTCATVKPRGMREGVWRHARSAILGGTEGCGRTGGG